MGVCMYLTARSTMRRLVSLILMGVPLAALVLRYDVRAAGPKAPVRGILVGPERVTPEFLAAWKAKGATAVVVPLDESSRRRWGATARTVEQAGMTLWPWVEWRQPGDGRRPPRVDGGSGRASRRLAAAVPKAPMAKAGEVVKAWPWVPIGYAPAFDAHREP